MRFGTNCEQNGITRFGIFLLCLAAMAGCTEDDPETKLTITSLQVGNDNLLEGSVNDVATDLPITISFSAPVDTASFNMALTITDEEGNAIALQYNFYNERRTTTIYPTEDLKTFAQYSINISSDLVGESGEPFGGAQYSFTTAPGGLTLEAISAGEVSLDASSKVFNIPPHVSIIATFSAKLSSESINTDNIRLIRKGVSIPTTTEVDGHLLTISPTEKLDYYTTYQIKLDTAIRGTGAFGFEGFEGEFFTGLDSTLKFPEISDEDLLTKIQEQTFKYFWNFGHPTSGLARERNTSGETVTIGGSGFGVMAIIVGIERGFITRAEGVERLLKIVNFLLTRADRFHGVWSHWLNGSTGEVRPFSADDDGGDLVETAFMIQGLLTVRQYLDDQDATEAEIIGKINQLWEEVEWDWYTQNDQNVLYWHWSPNFGWQKNHAIRGWNEALIVYVLAASSNTHTIDKSVYQSGWARNGGMRNGNTYYDIVLPLGSTRGGPLFFSHYSFLGLDPTNLEDTYANYWDQNVSHSLINRAYCENNPRKYVGYSGYCWGLTASDSHEGYAAHSPTNDLGVITPTAAISSIPYTPEESMAAIRHFYYILGDRLWGDYGFYDAFNISEEWTASSYLAIDQGTIILMMENYRTGLLWDLFMSAPEVQTGLTKLGFSYE